MVCSGGMCSVCGSGGVVCRRGMVWWGGVVCRRGVVWWRCMVCRRGAAGCRTGSRCGTDDNVVHASHCAQSANIYVTRPPHADINAAVMRYAGV